MHATFQYSGTPGKRNRLREADLFKDPESYYHTEKRGFLSSSQKIPDRLLRSAKKMKLSGKLDDTVPHFDLVHHQLRVIRSLFYLGTSLEREVIMPKTMCGLDRWWAPHEGHIPGSSFDLPFQCPLDHILDLERLSSNDLDENTNGPKVDWKEHSFLDKPEAAYLRQKALKVVTCNEESQECDDGSKQAVLINNRLVKLRAARTDVQIRNALLSHADKFDLIEFENPTKLWKGFQDDEKEKKFQARYGPAASLWCCVNPPAGGAGHVYYDFFWDILPHVNRFGNKVTSAWKPALGP